MEPQTVKENISKNLTSLMKKRGIGASDLMRMSNYAVTDQAIGNIMKGIHEPRTSVLYSLAEALGVHPDKLVGVSPPRKQKARNVGTPSAP